MALSTTPLSPVYEVVAERLNSQLSRVHLIDTKISALIAAVIAMMVVFLNKANEWYLWVPPVLFLFPLIELSRAFTVGEYQYHDPPGPEAFAKHYGTDPEATQIAIIQMIILATRTNAEITQAKGRRFDRGLTSSIRILLAVFVADIILQIPVVALWLPHTVPIVQSVRSVGTPTPPRASTVPTVRSVHTSDAAATK